jgi:FixJ family two-component response regulator
MSGSPVIHVVDDDPLFRKAVARLLKAAGYQIALYNSGRELLQGKGLADPGCILLDLRMAGLDGLELQQRLKETGCALPIVFLTGYGKVPTSVQAMKAGAEDFLMKPVAKQTLIDAVENALARGRKLVDERRRIDVLRGLVAALTARERQVFSLVVRGKMNKQIAFELGASERTIKAHRHAIMTKLNVRSVAAVVSIAERLGMLA